MIDDHTNFLYNKKVTITREVNICNITINI